MVRAVVLMVALTACSWGPPAAVDEIKSPEIVASYLQVDSMKECNRCAMNLRVAIREQEGIERVQINIKTGELIVTHDKNVIEADALVAAAAKAKQAAVFVKEGEPPDPEAPAAPKTAGDSDATDGTDAPKDVSAP